MIYTLLIPIAFSTVPEISTLSRETETETENNQAPLNSRGILKWKYPTPEGSYISTPALADLDKDGDLEVIFISDANAVYALTNTGELIWKNLNYTISRADQFMTGTGSDFYYYPPLFSSITPTDIVGDRTPELIFGADGDVVSLNASGSEYWAAGLDNRDYISTPAVADLARVENAKNTDREIVVIQDNSYSEMAPVIFSAKGELIDTLERPTSFTNLGFPSATISDLDGSTEPDSWMDIIFGNRYSPIRLYSYDSDADKYTRVTDTSSTLPCVVYGTGAVGDFVGDEELEYFIGTYEAGSTDLDVPSLARGVYYLYDPINESSTTEAARRLWSYSLPNTGSGFFGSPAVGDVHGGLSNPTTGKIGYEGFLGSYDGRIYCIDLNSGTRLWQYNTGSPIYSSPALCDINSDTSLEVIIGSNNGIIYCFDGDPTDDLDEGILDGGGTNYDILWQYDTGGNGTWVSSPVVADIDNDMNLEVVVGDKDGNVWCLNAGPTNLTGQSDWPMFQHDVQNTGVITTRSKTFKVTLELLNGDGDNNNICYAQYHPYVFRLIIEDGMGFTDLDNVKLTFDPVGYNVQCKWSRETNSFNVINDPYNLIDFFIESSNAYTDFDKTWTLDFNLTFNWSFATDRPIGCAVNVIGELTPTRNLFYKDFIEIENSLEFIGSLEVIGEDQGMLASGDWVRGEEEIFWTNLTVVYENTENVYPDIKKYKIVITDDEGNEWVSTPKAPGELIHAMTKMPGVTDPERTFYLTLSQNPSGMDWKGPTKDFVIRLDNTPPAPPSKVIIHADSFTDTNVIADNDTQLFITWTTPAQEYSGLGGYVYSFENITGSHKEIFTSNNFAEVKNVLAGEFYFYVSAVNTVGNIGEPTNGSILIDMDEVTFSSYHPKSSTWYNNNTINAGVTIQDSNGIGVDPASIQYSIKSETNEFGPWLSINQATDLTWQNLRKINVNSLITFPDRGTNYLRWRARDLAGNGYTVSNEIQLLLDDMPPKFVNPVAESTSVKDQRWVKCNITIIDDGGSGINASSIEYSYSITGTLNYTDWMNADLKMDSPKIIAEIILFLGYGKENYIKWRAKDTAESGYSESGDIQISVNTPPIVQITEPLNNSKFYIEDTLEFDARDTVDPDDDALSYSWQRSYVNNMGQEFTESLSQLSYFQHKLGTGANTITLFVNDGHYNISKKIFVFIYDQYTDLDKDGMPDWWEEQYFGLNPENQGDAEYDLDGDGKTNLQEYLDKTNPADPEDYMGKKDSSDANDRNLYILINLVFLIIVIVVLIIFFMIKRSRLKKAQFKKRQETTPAVLLRRDSEDKTKFRVGGKRPKVISDTAESRPPQLTPGGVSQPTQEMVPELPPHIPKKGSNVATVTAETSAPTETSTTAVTTATAKAKQIAQSDPKVQQKTQKQNLAQLQAQTNSSPTIDTTPPENMNKDKSGGED